VKTTPKTFEIFCYRILIKTCTEFSPIDSPSTTEPSTTIEKQTSTIEPSTTIEKQTSTTEPSTAIEKQTSS
jgi:hypothetical protein